MKGPFLEILLQSVDFFVFLFQFILKIDKYLETIILNYGVFVYVILFLIVFCETGLIVTPILPGDSLLFAVGAFSARGLLDFPLVVVLIMTAAILGDSVNYFVGRKFGAFFFREHSRYLKTSYIDNTNRFYEKYGSKTIVYARFVPIIRTFAPFIAGFGKMNYSKFMIYNVFGGIAWTLIFTLFGFFFGELPIIRESITMMTLGIIVVSVLPLLFSAGKEMLLRRRA